MPFPQGPSSSPSSPLASEAIHRLRNMAQRGAASHGLQPADRAECAVEFLEWAVSHPEHQRFSDSLLELCAEHRVIDFIRRHHRIHERERPLSADDGSGESQRWALRCSQGSPEDLVCRAETCREIRWAVSLLTPDQQDLFQRCFIEEGSVAEIAAALGLNENAVHQRVHVLRRAIQKRLRGRGIVPDDKGGVIDSIAI